MDNQTVQKHFAAMGARVLLHPPALVWARRRRNELPSPLVIDVRVDRLGEYFDIGVDAKLADIDVLDVRPKARHLLLLGRLDEGRRKDKFLCGHDERSWFVAAIPGDRGVSNVRTALEALKPESVRAAQDRLYLRSRDRSRRRNEAYVRQGEWFFVPAPDLVADPKLVFRNEPLRRGGGKPHMCAELYREGGTTVYVCSRHPNGLTVTEYERVLRGMPDARTWGWQTMRRNPRAYARGRVWHADHTTVVLPFWHRVEMNTENRSRAMAKLAFLD